MGNNMFSSAIIFSIITTIIVAFIFIFAIYKIIKTVISNNNSPVETRKAKVISKRTDISSIGGYQNNSINTYGRVNNTSFNTMGPNNINTYYYATFEFDNKERKEFNIGQAKYGLLAEGDEGMLTYQGTRFKSFDRNI